MALPHSRPSKAITVPARTVMADSPPHGNLFLRTSVRSISLAMTYFDNTTGTLYYGRARCSTKPTPCMLMEYSSPYKVLVEARAYVAAAMGGAQTANCDAM